MLYVWSNDYWLSVIDLTGLSLFNDGLLEVCPLFWSFWITVYNEYFDFLYRKRKKRSMLPKAALPWVWIDRGKFVSLKSFCLSKYEKVYPEPFAMVKESMNPLFVLQIIYQHEYPLSGLTNLFWLLEVQFEHSLYTFYC